MQKTNSNKGSLHCKDCPSRENGIFCAMELASLEDISNHKVTNVYKKGQTLFVQGNHPFGIYCVSSDNIKVSKIEYKSSGR